MRDLDSLKPEEIRAELTKMITETSVAEGGFESYHVMHEVANRLDSSTSRSKQGGWGFGAVFDRYTGRVKRVLDKMAAEGELVRYGDGDRLPNGHVSHRSVRYYTPETVRAAEAERDRKNAEADAIKQRWGQVEHELAGLGYFWAGDGRDHKLSLADWERLLAQWKQETRR